MSVCGRWHLRLHMCHCVLRSSLLVIMVCFCVCECVCIAHSRQRSANMSVCYRPPTHQALIWFVPVGSLVSVIDSGQALP